MRINQWLRQGTRIYFFVHCPIEIWSPSTALWFQDMLEEQKVPVPPLLWDALTTTPKQLKLF